MDTSLRVMEIIVFLIVGVPILYLSTRVLLWEISALEPNFYLDVFAAKLSTKLDFMIGWIKKRSEWSSINGLQFIAEEIQKSLEADLCVFYLFDQDKYRFAVYSQSLAPLPDADNEKAPREVLKIKETKKPEFWTEASRTTLSDPNYVRFKDFKAVVGIPLLTKDDFVGVLMIYYRRARSFGPIWKELTKPLARKVASVTRQIISSLDNVQLMQPDVLRVQIQLPSAVNVETYFDNTAETLMAISFIYSFYHILAYETPTNLRSFIDSLGQVHDLSTLTTSSLRRVWPHRTGSLRIRSIHYGSPASFDFLGVGKVLEVVKDTVKDLIWRGSHEKKMAELEFKSKLAELSKSERDKEISAIDLELRKVQLQKEKLENDKLELELAERSIDLAQKAFQLPLSESDKDLFITVIRPKMRIISPPANTTLSIPELESLLETTLISKMHKNPPANESLGQLPPP